MPAKTAPFARLDFERPARTGLGETVFGPGKSAAQLAAIFTEFAARRERALATRVTPVQYAEFRRRFSGQAQYDEVSQTLTTGRRVCRRGRVAVLTGGTADIPAAEEAAKTLEFFGIRVERFYDVGVAGLHRLLAVLKPIRRAEVVIAAAGMEGALASVVAGLVTAPVIALPTSVGYGSGTGGVAAALAMLNSCAEGVGVVNIDNGFGAAALAAKILKGKRPCSSSKRRAASAAT